MGSAQQAQIWRTDNTKQPEGKPAISLTLSVNPKQVKLGESAQLEVSLKNLSVSEIYVYKDIGKSDNSSYDVFVVDDKKRGSSDNTLLPPSSRDAIAWGSSRLLRHREP